MPDGEFIQRRGSEQVIARARLLTAGVVALQLALGQADVPVGMPFWLFPGAGIVLLVAAPTIWLLLPRIDELSRLRQLGAAALTIDVLVALTIVWAHAGTPQVSIWIVLFLVGIECAIRFDLIGTAISWAALTAAYTGRELFAQARFDLTLEVASITFRMGMVLAVMVIVAVLHVQLAEQRDRLAEAVEDLEETERWRVRLIGVLGHDVRSPLTSIVGTLQLLESRDRLDEETIDDLLTSALRQATRVQLLSRDLLDLARDADEGLTLRVEPVHLRELVDDVVGRFAGDIDVDVADDLRVPADPARLEQVLHNLVQNALHHGGPPVAVRAHRSDDVVEIVVEDSGDGIPSTHRDTLFTAFGSHAEEDDSVGLGLWIVRMITEEHGGSVRYEPRPGGGSRFVAAFPASGGP